MESIKQLLNLYEEELQKVEKRYNEAKGDTRPFLEGRLYQLRDIIQNLETIIQTS